MRRSPSDPRAGIHPEVVLFFSLTLAVSAVSLMLGLLIRASVAGSADGKPVKLMKLDSAVAANAVDHMERPRREDHVLPAAADAETPAAEQSSVHSKSVEGDRASPQAVAVDHDSRTRPRSASVPQASPKTVSTHAAHRPTHPEPRTFAGRPLRKVREVAMLVTAYSPDARSCGKWTDGVTASGYSVTTNGMKLVAADTDLLPFGSIVTIPGYDDGHPVPVLDRGGAIRGRRLDVLYPTHRRAMKWGVRRLTVTVWEYAD